MTEAQRNTVLTSLRLITSAISGVVATKGWVSATDWQLYTGAFFTVAPLAWEIWNTFHSSTDTVAREASALNAGIVLSNQTATPTSLVPATEAKAVIEQYAPSKETP